MINRRYRELPNQVRNWLLSYGGWLVGSGADWYLSEPGTNSPKDWDIIIPHEHFMEVCRSLDKVEINSFGGLKVQIGEASVDVWPSTLDAYVTVNNKQGPKAAVRLRPWAVVRW